jgi:hypothetical protein
MWVLLNSSDGKVYAFKESYVRTSSKEYKEFDPDVDPDDQIFMQLTNNAIQKDGKDYGKFEEGNIISTDQLFTSLATTAQAMGKSKQDLIDKFDNDTKEIIRHTMNSVKTKLISQKHTFELFGYDFILDENFNTILIEVNTNPSFAESCRLLKGLLPRMFDDMFNIVMDPLFHEPGAKYKSSFTLSPDFFSVDGQTDHSGYKDDENLFKHIYTLDLL